MPAQTLMWIAFGVLVVTIMALDLGVFHRKAHAIKLKEALTWSAVWISLALLFNVGVYFLLGSEKALNFFTAYLVEESLSVDNLFVFLMIFSYFSVPDTAQHKVLFWGILGALIMRAIFIVTGLTIVEKIHWVIYIFGAFLIFTGIKLSMGKGREVHPENNPILRIFRRFVPATKDYHGNRFFVRLDGRLLATPLFFVILVIETTDVMFAVDSVPAVLSVTLDPFIVYTSNVFAILGLRSIFFALAGVTLHLRYLSHGLAVILIFLGVKMISSAFYKIPVGVALGVVGGILAISIIASLVSNKKEHSGHLKAEPVLESADPPEKMPPAV